MSAAQTDIAPAAEARTRPLRIAVIGHSHIAAIMKGYKEFREVFPLLPVRLIFGQLTNREFRPVLTKEGLNPAVVEMIETAMVRAVISCVAGNAHNVVGLLNHPTRFDFVLPQQPDLPLDETVDVVPSGIVSECLKASLEQNAFPVLTALRDAVSLPIFHLESPPPIPSAEHIAQIPDSVFSDRIAELGVAPALLRYKLWCLHSALVEAFCNDAGITYLPVPAETQDSDGMLAESCWGNATHGNEVFGSILVQSAVARIKAQLSPSP